eukprot:GILI01013803.1.p1 GENE.GILI01013803.1~~GILI01013803.1.p1  ORF type:complete len:169 (+),score=52.18 GILI01013803.1:157-663(+)
MRRVFSSAFTVAAITPIRTKYSDKVLDHYSNPRNVGKLDETDDNVTTGMMGAAECGDMMKIGLKINPDTLVIEDAKFKAFGCGSAIAASSFATEAIRGKTLAEALALTNKDIAKELNLPPVKLHCSMLAEETIRAAVNKYLARKPQLKSKVVREKKPEVAATAQAASH